SPGVWNDRWSTRWNPNVFAHQGYFVVAINPTGSTTFGQGQPLSRHAAPNCLDTCLSINFTDAITKGWGGKPFIDLQRAGNTPQSSIRRSILIMRSRQAPAGTVTL
ncbi:hypothetical protein BJV78DRAFT_1238405, partial [Lactifluus subvellereus]